MSFRELATFPNLPTLVSVENDATLAKQACSVGYAYKRRVEQYAHCSHIMNIAVKQLVAVSDLLLHLWQKNLKVQIRTDTVKKVIQVNNYFFVVLF